jgi:hypothetical protein
MKKIIGSPIGLGEVNLTVDNRVRRCIKEYFGNVDNNNSEIQQAIREDAKQDQEETDDIADNAVDEMIEEACNKAQCKKWDSSEKKCNSEIKKCEDTHPLSICCVTDDCKGQKRIRWREETVITGIVFICVILIAIIFALRYVQKSYYKDYKDNAWEMFNHLWPYTAIMIFALFFCPLVIVLHIMVIIQTINGTLQPPFITCEDEIAKKKCESDVTRKWDSSEKKCVFKCENGKICTGDKCKCECPKGETYRSYGPLGKKKKCVENCKYPEKYCKKYGKCVTSGTCV